MGKEHHVEALVTCPLHRIADDRATAGAHYNDVSEARLVEAGVLDLVTLQNQQGHLGWRNSKSDALCRLTKIGFPRRHRATVGLPLPPHIR